VHCHNNATQGAVIVTILFLWTADLSLPKPTPQNGRYKRAEIVLVLTVIFFGLVAALIHLSIHPTAAVRFLQLPDDCKEKIPELFPNVTALILLNLINSVLVYSTLLVVRVCTVRRRAQNTNPSGQYISLQQNNAGT
jgi:NADH:ubiquinone oxidoreductase subunit 6 (subunit J)